MTGEILPFERYPGVPTLFLDFVRGRSPFHPDLPTLDAAAARGRELLGRASRIPAAAFRSRHPEGRAWAEELAAGRRVAVAAGHQIGLFTGPLFTLWKAFDVIRIARELTARGVPSAPVFWALTDDHDLEEVARTNRPGRDGPETLILEGADRSNRRPVGGLTLPEGVEAILAAFRQDARAPDGQETLEAFAARYAPGRRYGEAFIETLFDLVGPEPLLVLDPLCEELREPAAEFYRLAARRESALREALRKISARLGARGQEPPVAYREGTFPFFAIRDGERRRVEDLRSLEAEIASGAARVSADVLTRPVLKSFLFPVAASVLGPAEIAYHAQALPLFPALGVEPPVLLPRSHLILRGPADRRAMKALGLTLEELAAGRSEAPGESVPGSAVIGSLDGEIAERLAALSRELQALDPTLIGAVENARRKISYQIEQLETKVRKAAERRRDTAQQRRRRLETMLFPRGVPAERVYPPLVAVLAHGRKSLELARDAAKGSTEGAVVVDLGAEGEAEEGERDAG
ncbi:MAG: bacillithiol biosynthesis BshC [Thermoanaerobaculia bacterium]